MARGDDGALRAAELAFRAELADTKTSFADAVDNEARMRRLLDDTRTNDLAAKYPSLRKD